MGRLFVIWRIAPGLGFANHRRHGDLIFFIFIFTFAILLFPVAVTAIRVERAVQEAHARLVDEVLHEDRRDDDDARQRRVALPGQEAVLPGGWVVVERGIDLRGLLVFARGLLVVFEVIAARRQTQSAS